MRRRWGLLLGSLLVATACTASSTSADDAARPSEAGSDGGAQAAPGDPELGALTRVTGTLDNADLIGTLEQPATLPLVLTVPARGGGNGAVVTGVEASGGDTIVWDGGRPITITGDGTVVLQPGTFRVHDGGLHADMGGAAHPLSPGSYAVSGPVAVGDGAGLAVPSTQTPFSAGDGAVVSGTGQVEGRLPPGTWLILGPGRLTLTGTLEVQTSESTEAATTTTVEGGSYEATFTVLDDGSISVVALVEGAVTAG